MKKFILALTSLINIVSGFIPIQTSMNMVEPVVYSSQLLQVSQSSLYNIDDDKDAYSMYFFSDSDSGSSKTSESILHSHSTYVMSYSYNHFTSDSSSQYSNQYSSHSSNHYSSQSSIQSLFSVSFFSEHHESMDRESMDRESMDDDESMKNDDSTSETIDDYDMFVKVDLDIIGETKTTFDPVKQKIFIDSVSSIVNVNSDLIWFETITDINDINLQNRYLLSTSRNLGQQSINAILGIAVNEITETGVIDKFKGSIDDGSLLNLLQTNGLTITLNVNDISTVLSPDLTDDSNHNQGDDIVNSGSPSSDDKFLNHKKFFIMGCVMGSTFTIAVSITIYKHIKNRVKPSSIPFASVFISKSKAKPYFKY